MRISSQLKAFLTQEWLKIPIGAAIGIAFVLLKRLLFDDPVFRAFVLAKLAASTQNPASFDSYRVPLELFVGVALLTGLIKLLPFLVKVLQSWITGIVSGLTTCWALSFFGFLALGSVPLTKGLLLAIASSLFLSILSFVFRLLAVGKSSIDQHVSFSIPKSNSGLTLQTLSGGINADCPIADWDHDLLERSSLVESLATAVIVGKATVVAIQGQFGDGKSSVLNLLRTALEPHAIVVTFSTWLPGSEETLAIDLFSDIAIECKKRYYMPQLRRRLLAYAKTICGSVSFLRSAPELLPSTSQKDEIAEMARSLNRVPRRIVVLLDEIDRLQKEELQIVLKVLRGVALFPNLSYVRAFDHAQLEKTAFGSQNSESRAYFEKFFPITFQVPKPDSTLLLRVLRTKIDDILANLHWFSSDQERGQFTKTLEQSWDESVVHLCTNLRKVFLVINDFSNGARSLLHEVNSNDLFLLQILQRFFPTIYESVWKNQFYLWNRAHHLKRLLFLRKSSKRNVKLSSRS